MAVAVAAAVAFVAGTAPAGAAPRVENWTGDSPYFSSTGAPGGSPSVVSHPEADDGKALRMQLEPRPAPGPGGGVEIASNDKSYGYGTYGTRIRTADCTGQGRVGVVTGTFTYSSDHSDANGNGVPDNDEIDVEVLCAQPHVLWLTIWTDYSDATGAVRKISRAIDMRTGRVLYNCYVTQLGGDCADPVEGENNPASVTPIEGFNAATQFHTYLFDWQPGSVTFWTYNDDGSKNVLWDYRGPANRIPHRPSAFMQNVWHTNSWDPLDGPAHDQPQAATTAYIDSTTLPR
ncbi:glycoside hydrolase family 16 protein [Streptomyces sp. NEAU-YJ-81]|nr:glycoside hydrolase family 16 protein [Streptomyces sp. NEAU-YJ-81]